MSPTPVLWTSRPNAEEAVIGAYRALIEVTARFPHSVALRVSVFANGEAAPERPPERVNVPAPEYDRRLAALKRQLEADLLERAQPPGDPYPDEPTARVFVPQQQARPEGVYIVRPPRDRDR